MESFRAGVETIGPKNVETVLDYSKGLDGLPKSDVLKYLLADNCSVVVRPSGTEPKLKAYISVSAESRTAAEMLEAEIVEALKGYFA
jgi:phosphoglucomutase